MGEIDDEKEANMNLKEVGLEEILEAQSRQLAEKEEQDSLSTCPSHILTHPESSFVFFWYVEIKASHTTCSWDIMCQKWEGDCGLWVLNEMIKKTYTESLKKIVGAVWELPAK